MRALTPERSSKGADPCGGTLVVPLAVTLMMMIWMTGQAQGSADAYWPRETFS
jgi:hypothetical protein